MELKFKRWQDFNNLSIKVTISKKIYDGEKQIKTMISSQENFYLIVKKFSL